MDPLIQVRKFGVRFVKNMNLQDTIILNVQLVVVLEEND